MIKQIINEIKLYGFKYTIKHIKRKTSQLMDKFVCLFILIFSSKNQLGKIIIIESHNDFDCNGGAFYEYLVKERINENYTIVWLVKNKVRKKLPKNVKAYNIWNFSIKKNYFLCRAKYLLSDDIITEKKDKRQISIYCSHGACTLKNVKGLIVVPESVDYVLSSSKNFDPYICNNFSIKYPNKKMLHIGFPSNDILFDDNKNELSKFCEEVNYRKIILWMPTFRKGGGECRNDSIREYGFGVPLIESIEQLTELNKLLLNNSTLLIIKIHPMQDISDIETIEMMSNIKVLDGKSVKQLDVDVYRLMSCADALISDYSSVTYSYLLLNRPIGFVLEDMKEYTRGFSVDNLEQFLVGEQIYTFVEFVEFINKICFGEDDFKRKREELRSWMYLYCDNHSCKRLTEFLELNSY